MEKDAQTEIDAARRAETERLRRGLARIALAVGCAALAAAALWWIGSRSDLESYIAAETVIEERARLAAPRVLDPGCRALGERVAAFRASFEGDAQAIERDLGAGIDEVGAALAKVGALRASLESARIASEGARYQYDESAGEVRSWLDYVDRHLQGWERHGAERRAALEETPIAVDLRRVKKKKKPGVEAASLEERRARVGLGVREALDEFRVWQQDDGPRNPCVMPNEPG